MKRKSVYLFSVAILGFSLVPSHAWADEVEEAVVPTVTAELVESPVSTTEPPVSESAQETVQPVEEVVPEETEAVTDATTPVKPESTSEETTATESVEATEATETTEAPASPSMEANATVEPAAKQQKAARAATPALKDQNDGKIVDHEKTITDEEAKISAEYNFMPQFDKLEGIVVNSAGGYSESTNYYSFDLKKETAGSITVIYKNVGTYNGKVIDMKVTVKDWSVLTGSWYSPSIFIHKKNGVTMRGIKDVHLNYSFLDNLTASAVNVSGFFNFTDIDLEQSIDLFDNNNVQNYYVTKGNVLYFKNHNGYIKIGEINQEGTSPTNMDHWLTYTYKNVSSFDVRYNQAYESGAVFNYTYQAPIVIEETPTEPEVGPEKPIKEILEKPDEGEDTKEVVQTEPKAVSLAVETKKTAAVPIEAAKAEPLKQAVLPQTNDQASSIFTILGGACLFLLSAIFINKKRV